MRGTLRRVEGRREHPSTESEDIRRRERNVANPMAGCGVQQTRRPRAEQAVEVERDHEDGTRAGHWHGPDRSSVERGDEREDVRHLDSRHRVGVDARPSRKTFGSDGWHAEVRTFGFGRTHGLVSSVREVSSDTARTGGLRVSANQDGIAGGGERPIP